jgi:hypothetical protein
MGPARVEASVLPMDRGLLGNDLIQLEDQPPSAADESLVRPFVYIPKPKYDPNKGKKPAKKALANAVVPQEPFDPFGLGGEFAADEEAPKKKRSLAEIFGDAPKPEKAQQPEAEETHTPDVFDLLDQFS